jgi:hypothetical protein
MIKLFSCDYVLLSQIIFYKYNKFLLSVDLTLIKFSEKPDQIVNDYVVRDLKCLIQININLTLIITPKKSNPLYSPSG